MAILIRSSIQYMKTEEKTRMREHGVVMHGFSSTFVFHINILTLTVFDINNKALL